MSKKLPLTGIDSLDCAAGQSNLVESAPVGSSRLDNQHVSLVNVDYDDDCIMVESKTKSVKQEPWKTGKLIHCDTIAFLIFSSCHPQRLKRNRHQ